MWMYQDKKKKKWKTSHRLFDNDFNNNFINYIIQRF